MLVIMSDNIVEELRDALARKGDLFWAPFPVRIWQVRENTISGNY